MIKAARTGTNESAGVRGNAALVRRSEGKSVCRKTPEGIFTVPRGQQGNASFNNAFPILTSRCRSTLLAQGLWVYDTVG